MRLRCRCCSLACRHRRRWDRPCNSVDYRVLQIALSPLSRCGKSRPRGYCSPTSAIWWRCTSDNQHQRCRADTNQPGNNGSGRKSASLACSQQHFILLAPADLNSVNIKPMPKNTAHRHATHTHRHAAHHHPYPPPHHHPPPTVKTKPRIQLCSLHLIPSPDDGGGKKKKKSGIASEYKHRSVPDKHGHAVEHPALRAVWCGNRAGNGARNGRNGRNVVKMVEK